MLNYLCVIILKVYGGNYVLKKHLSIPHRFECQFCPAKFVKDMDINKHISLVHPNESNPVFFDQKMFLNRLLAKKWIWRNISDWFIHVWCFDVKFALSSILCEEAIRFTVSRKVILEENQIIFQSLLCDIYRIYQKFHSFVLQCLCSNMMKHLKKYQKCIFWLFLSFCQTLTMRNIALYSTLLVICLWNSRFKSKVFWIVFTYYFILKVWMILNDRKGITQTL